MYMYMYLVIRMLSANNKGLTRNTLYEDFISYYVYTFMNMS